MFEFLSFIPIWLGVGLAVLGLGGLFFKNKISDALGIVGKPLGLKVTTTLMILGIVGIIVGGASITGFVGGLLTPDVTATFRGIEMIPLEGTDLECTLTTKSLTSALGDANATWRSDPSDNQHYYVDVINATGILANGINGTLTCLRPASHVGEDGAVECWVKGEEFRSETSTTDANIYNLLLTGTSASRIEGETWAYTSYLNDGAVATPSSSVEKTIIAFAESEAEEDLGFYLTLGGATSLNYLNAQSSLDAEIICSGETVYTITVTKISI